MRKSLPVAILAVTALLTAAAIEYLPATLYFPVVEYAMPGDIQIVMLKYGEPDKIRCEKSAGLIASSVRGSCPTCKTTERCARGLDAGHRKILSREPLTTSSLRTQNGKLIMTVSAKIPEVASSVCRLAAEQTATQTADKKLLCFTPLTPR